MGEFNNVLDCILNCCDTIIFSTEILKEYVPRSIPYGLFPWIFLTDLENVNKAKFRRTGYIEQRFERQNRIRKYKLPSHTQDQKWIKTAVAVEARYILTRNKHLLNLAPFRYNGDNSEIIDPVQYIQIRCTRN